MEENDATMEKNFAGPAVTPKEVTLKDDVVRARLSVLEHLLDNLDEQFGPLTLSRQRQGTAMWTTVPACTKFAQAYGSTLDTLDASLRAVRSNIATLQQSLALSAATLAATDQDIQDRLTALARRLEEGPPEPPGVCTPYDVVPAAPTTPTPPPTPGGGGTTW